MSMSIKTIRNNKAKVLFLTIVLMAIAIPPLKYIRHKRIVSQQQANARLENENAYISRLPLSTAGGVVSISWRPFKVYFKKGEVVHLVLQANKGDIDDYEFQILSSTKPRQWDPILNKDNQSWSSGLALPDIILDEESITSLHVNVRRRTNKEILQKSWLGQLFVGKNIKANRDDLFKSILSGPGKLNLQYTALELQFLLENLWYSVQNSAPTPSPYALAQKIFTPHGFRVSKQGGKITIADKTGPLQIFIEKQLISTNTGQSYYFNPQAHPELLTIMNDYKNTSKELAVAASLTYLVASGYDYSQIDDFYIPWSPANRVAECGKMSEVLTRLLSFQTHATAAKTLILNYGNGLHQVTEAKIHDQYYTLDPTTNNVFGPSSQSLIQSLKLGPQYALPFIRDLDNLVLSYPLKTVNALPDSLPGKARREKGGQQNNLKTA